MGRQRQRQRQWQRAMISRSPFTRRAIDYESESEFYCSQSPSSETTRDPSPRRQIHTYTATVLGMYIQDVCTYIHT